MVHLEQENPIWQRLLQQRQIQHFSGDCLILDCPERTSKGSSERQHLLDTSLVTILDLELHILLVDS